MEGDASIRRMVRIRVNVPDSSMGTTASSLSSRKTCVLQDPVLLLVTAPMGETRSHVPVTPPPQVPAVLSALLLRPPVTPTPACMAVRAPPQQCPTRVHALRDFLV